MNVKIILIYIVTIFFISGNLSARTKNTDHNGSETDTTAIDLCKVDITKLKELNGKDIKAFGLQIGHTLEEAKNIVENNPDFQLKLEQDKYNNNRFYLYEILAVDSIKVPIGLCKWEIPNKGMSEIILYEPVAECVAGDSYRFFTAEVADSASVLFTNILGKPAKTVIDLDIPSIGLKTTRYYYPKNSLIIIENIKRKEITYQLAFYKSPFY